MDKWQIIVFVVASQWKGYLTLFNVQSFENFFVAKRNKSDMMLNTYLTILKKDVRPEDIHDAPTAEELRKVQRAQKALQPLSRPRRFRHAKNDPTFIVSTTLPVGPAAFVARRLPVSST